jgi:hypothetical protein
VQVVGVADATKFTERGTAPESGVAEAMHEREQTGTWETVTVPALVHVTPLTVDAMVQE